MSTKRELQEENERLRGRLEEAYDVIGDALELENDEDPSEELESDPDDEDEE
jgi:hypothetical protein